MEFIRTPDQIDDQINRASDGRDHGSQYPLRSYEQGVLDYADWLQGSDTIPFPHPHPDA